MSSSNSGNGRNVGGGAGGGNGGSDSGAISGDILGTNKTTKSSKSSTLSTSSRFVPFRRRTSDTTTTSESESDADFGIRTTASSQSQSQQQSSKQQLGVASSSVILSSSSLSSPLAVPLPSPSSTVTASVVVAPPTKVALHRHSLHQIPLMPSAVVSKQSNEELSSSYSRSSSESCNSSNAGGTGPGKGSNLHCMLQDLSELSQLGAELENDLMSVAQSENLNDFRSRLNMRRKLKSRDCFYMDDDRSNASLDSTTTQAHREILRSADLLRQEPEIYSISYNAGPSSSYTMSHVQQQQQQQQQKQQFQHQLQQNQQQNSQREYSLQQQAGVQKKQSEPKRGQPSISRSKTESNFRSEDVDSSQKSVMGGSGGKSSPSPRFGRRKTQVLKAATSIPSLLFSNKSTKSSKTMSYYQDSAKNSPAESKKNSIDDDSIFATKARRSPLRFLGNLVDDKIFRGRWSSQKRAKSTDEITWALANEELLLKQNQSDNMRKKSLGFFASPTREEDRFVKSQTISVRPKNSSSSAMMFTEYSAATGRQSSQKMSQQQQQQQQRNDNDLGIDPATLAEIELSNTASEIHFAVTPSKTRKAKLSFEDIPDDESINESLNSTVGRQQKSPAKENQPPNGQVEDHGSDVGFSYLPTQIRRKILSKPLAFTLMVAGSSGLGKSTFVNSLFLTDIYSPEYPGPTERSKTTETVSVESTSVVLTENNVSLNVTIVDTPGFARDLDNSRCWKPLIAYLKTQHCDYLQGEINFDPQINDTRVNCCLYFIAPTGHSLQKLDIECMKQLSKHVNLIPVIGKADTMTPEEIKVFKAKIREDLSKNEISIFSFDLVDSDAENAVTEIEFPFAVAGSNSVKELPDGQRIRVREYPYGTFEIDNPKHCDTSLLRNLLVKHCMYDLIESTHSIHYENYRRDCLARGIVTNPVFKHRENIANMTVDNTLIRAMNATCEDTFL